MSKQIRPLQLASQISGLASKASPNVGYMGISAGIAIALVAIFWGVVVPDHLSIPFSIFTGHIPRAFYFISGVALGVALVILLGSQISRFMSQREKAGAVAIAEFINEGVLLMDEGTICYANPLIYKILGIPSNAKLKLSAQVRQILENVHSSHAPIHHETTIEGRHRHFLVSLVRLSKSRSIYLFQDVTFLRESEEAKSNFIGTLSHEIKTPLTSLSMALAMLDRSGFDPELLRIANVDVARLRKLLEDLLDASKLKVVRNLQTLQKRDTNFNALVRHSMRSAATLPILREKRLQLNFKIEPQCQIRADVDPAKISWAISALINEAIRHSVEENAIDVVLREHDFSIEFERGFEIVDTGQQGIVRDIIEAHDGSFIFQDRPGKRSVFRFSIQGNTNRVNSGVRNNEANLIG